MQHRHLHWKSYRAAWQALLKIAFWCLLAQLYFSVHAGPVLRLDSASLITTIDGQVIHSSVNLPYHWDQNHPGRQGRARFTFHFSNPQDIADSELGLFIPKLGNTYRIYLNGELIAAEGEMEQHNKSDYALLPHKYLIPKSLLKSINTIDIDIKADIGRKAGLSAPQIGAMDDLNIPYQTQLKWYVLGTLFVSLFSFFVGGIALSLWLSQLDHTLPAYPRRDPLYGYAAIAELTWALGVVYVLIESPIVQWPWWGILTTTALGVWSTNMCLFCIEAIGRKNFSFEIIFRSILKFLLATCPIAAYLALSQGMPRALTAWYIILAITVVFIFIIYLKKVIIYRKIPDLILLLAISINLGVGMYDLYSVRVKPQYEQFTLIRFSSVLFGLALLYIIINRFINDSAQARDLLLTLESRVQEREIQLRNSFKREEELLMERERTSERRRILQDMHDSVGSHLSLAIRQLESSKVEPDLLLDTLRDSMDQLKLTIDAVNLPAGNLNSLLANLRYRMLQRIENSGLEVEWEVEELPQIERLDSLALRQLQFILYEAVSNTLQHAKASKLQIKAVCNANDIEIFVNDNGTGFNSELIQKKGLAQMRRRANSFDAAISLETGNCGTSLCIKITRSSLSA